MNKVSNCMIGQLIISIGFLALGIYHDDKVYFKIALGMFLGTGAALIFTKTDCQR